MPDTDASRASIDGWLSTYEGSQGALALLDDLSSVPGRSAHITSLHLILDANNYDDHQDDLYAMALNQFHSVHSLQEFRITIKGTVLFTRYNYLVTNATTATEPVMPSADGKSVGATVRWTSVSPDYKALLRGATTAGRIAKDPVRVLVQPKTIVSALLGIRGVSCVRVDGPMDFGLNEELISTMSAADVSSPTPDLTMASTKASSPPSLKAKSAPVEDPQKPLQSPHAASSLSSPLSSPPPSPNINQPPLVRGFKPLHDEYLGFVGWYITDAIPAKRLQTARCSSPDEPADDADKISLPKRDGAPAPQRRQHGKVANPPVSIRRDCQKRKDGDVLQPEHTREEELRVEDMVRICATVQIEDDHSVYVDSKWIVPTGLGARIVLGWRVRSEEKEGAGKNRKRPSGDGSRRKRRRQ